MGSPHGLNVCTTSPDSTSTRTTCPELYPTASTTLSGLQTIAVILIPSPLLGGFQTLLHDNLLRKTSPIKTLKTKKNYLGYNKKRRKKRFHQSCLRRQSDLFWKTTKGFQLKPFQEYVSRHSVSSYTKPFLSCFFIFTRKFQSEMSE